MPATTLPFPTAGIVLCGGQSSRMGRPKALLEFAGETLLTRVCRILAEVVQPIVVVAGPDQDVPTDAAPVTLVRDPAAYEGPLRGIAEGLTALPAGVETAYVSACDVPLLRTEWIRFMISRLGAADIAVPVAGGRVHPLAGVYRQSVAPVARKLLAEGRHRPIFLLERCPAVRVSEEELRAVDPELDSLQNVNTPEEFQALLERWRARTTP